MDTAARVTTNEQGILYNITIYCTDLELHLRQTENARLKLTISQNKELNSQSHG